MSGGRRSRDKGATAERAWALGSGWSGTVARGAIDFSPHGEDQRMKLARRIKIYSCLCRVPAIRRDIVGQGSNGA